MGKQSKEIKRTSKAANFTSNSKLQTREMRIEKSWSKPSK